MTLLTKQATTAVDLCQPFVVAADPEGAVSPLHHLRDLRAQDGPWHISAHAGDAVFLMPPAVKTAVRPDPYIPGAIAHQREDIVVAERIHRIAVAQVLE